MLSYLDHVLSVVNHFPKIFPKVNLYQGLSRVLAFFGPFFWDLEKRYLCFLTWEQIAMDMNYGIDNVFKLHKKVLACVVVPEKTE